MSDPSHRVALVGSWADAIDDRRSVAAELAVAWPRSSEQLAVFADASADIAAELARSGVTRWPEGAFGRHHSRDEFDHVVLMIGPRLDSLLSLGRSADSGCHVWLQGDVVDRDGLPIDAPTNWLGDVIASARSVIVGSDWLAGVVRRISPDGPPVLVMPPAYPNLESIVDTPQRVVASIGGDDDLHRFLAERLSATVVRLDDTDVTPSVRESRVLSARAGVEIGTTERGFASTTLTHMMARGVPMITTLGAHAPFAADESISTGLVVVERDDDLGERLVEHLAPILDDDRQWLAASTAAKATAASWTWGDAADVLSQWITSVDALDPSTVRIVGATA